MIGLSDLEYAWLMDLAVGGPLVVGTECCDPGSLLPYIVMHSGLIALEAAGLITCQPCLDCGGIDANQYTITPAGQRLAAAMDYVLSFGGY